MTWVDISIENKDIFRNLHTITRNHIKIVENIEKYDKNLIAEITSWCKDIELEEQYFEIAKNRIKNT